MKFEEALEIIRLAPNYTLSQHTEPEVAIKRSCWHEHRMVVRSDDTLFVIVKHYTENENSWFLEEWKECAADLLANDWEIKR